MQRLTQSTNQAINEIKTTFEGVNQSFESMRGIFEAALAVLSGGEIANKLNEIAERGASMRENAEIFNLSTTALQGLQVVAASTGVSSEKLERTMATLEQKMRTAGETGGQAAEKFNQLGITTEELRDPTFTVQDAMEKLGASTNSNAELLSVLGARGAAVIPMLRELANNHDAVSDAAARVGALTTEETGALAGYRGQVEITAAALDNFKSRIAIGVIPAMETLLNEMAKAATDMDSATTASDLFKVAIEAVGEEVFAFIGQVKDIVDALAMVGRVGVLTFTDLGKAVVDATHGRFSQAARDMGQYAYDIKGAWQGMWDSFDANSREAGERLKSLQDAVEAKPIQAPALPQASTALLPDLSKQAETIEQQMDKAFDEIERSAASKMEQAFNQIKASAADSAKAQEESQTGSIDRQIAAVQELGRTHQLGNSQELAQETALLNQKWAAEKEYYDKLKSLYAENTERLASTSSQEEAAYQKHLDALEKAQATSATAMQKDWTKMSDQIAAGFSRAIDGMITKNRTFAQTVLSLGQSLVTGLINNFVKMGVAWVEQEILKMIASRTSAAGVVAASAGAAGAAGTASFAAAPWPIDLGAAGFGAAMAAVAGSFAVAEQGYDIPSGINPMVQAHAREMVLPAAESDVIRDMADGGSSGGGLHVHLQSHDTKGFTQQLRNSSSDLHKALTGYVKRGGR